MRTSEQFQNPNGGRIDVAKVEDGGNSSWGEKEGRTESSIRLAWHKEDGGFDPISSAELPLWGFKDLINAAADRDMYGKAELAEMIGHLTASLYRQS